MQRTASASPLRSSSLPTFATPTKEGILKKKGVGVAGVWQKRWHAIDSSFLGWWKDVKKPDNIPPRGWVNLEGCSLFVFAGTTQLALQASKNDMPKTYHWKAATEEERDAWAAAMISAGASLRTPSSTLSSSAPEPPKPITTPLPKPLPFPQKKFATIANGQSSLNRLPVRPEPITGLRPFTPPSLRHQLHPGTSEEEATETSSSSSFDAVATTFPASYTESDTASSSSSNELFPSVPTHSHTPAPVPVPSSTYAASSPVKGGSLIEQHKKSHKPLPQPGSMSTYVPHSTPSSSLSSSLHGGVVSLYDFPAVPSSPDTAPPVLAFPTVPTATPPPTLTPGSPTPPHNSKKPLPQSKIQPLPHAQPQPKIQPQPLPKIQPLPQPQSQPQPQPQSQVKTKPKAAHQMRSVSVFEAVPVPVEYFETPLLLPLPSPPPDNDNDETGEQPATTTPTPTANDPLQIKRQPPQRPDRPKKVAAGEKEQRRRSKSVSSLSSPSKSELQQEEEEESPSKPKPQKRPYPKVVSYMTVKTAVVEPVEAIPFDARMHTFSGSTTTPNERPSIMTQYPWEN